MPKNKYFFSRRILSTDTTRISHDAHFKIISVFFNKHTTAEDVHHTKEITFLYTPLKTGNCQFGIQLQYTYETIGYNHETHNSHTATYVSAIALPASVVPQESSLS